MSQSIQVKGIYRNNKNTSVGLHNPVNNRNANKTEFQHLYDMMAKYICPKGSKFKRTDYTVYLQDGSKHPALNLDMAIDMVKNDTTKAL